MKKLLSHTVTVVIFLVVTVVSLGFYAYMIARPISYGMGYYTETEYGGEIFEREMKFRRGGAVITTDGSYSDPMESRYYYKDGHVFMTLARTDEEYEEEVAYIEENFDLAIEAPFYATTTNAFRQVIVGIDGYTLVYTCRGAITFAIAFGIFEILLIALSCVSLILRKRALH